MLLIYCTTLCMYRGLFSDTAADDTGGDDNVGDDTDDTAVQDDTFEHEDIDALFLISYYS